MAGNELAEPLCNRWLREYQGPSSRECRILGLILGLKLRKKRGKISQLSQLDTTIMNKRIYAILTLQICRMLMRKCYLLSRRGIR